MKMTTHRPRLDRAERLAAETPGWLPEDAGRGDLEAALAGAPLFEGMSSAEIGRALSRFDEVRFPRGRRVVLEGMRGSDFFLVVVGTASVLVDGWRVATLGPGDFFGEIAVLGDGHRSASVRAETPLHCMVVANGGLQELIVEHPQVGINLIRIVIARYQAITGRRQPPAGELAG